MSNKIKRVRCLVCNKLVLRQYDPNTPDASFSIIPLRVQKKIGCVCADCIEKYSDVCTSPDIWNSVYPNDDQYDKSENSSNTNTEAKTTESSNENNEKADSKIDSSTYDDLTEDEQADITELIHEKYKILDYSLDSLAARVKEVVFGQNEAVEKVVYSLYLNQMLNMLEELGISFDHLNSGGSPGFKRRHILLIGDTGVGKTLLATTAPKVFNVTHSISNVTPITASGYVGEDVSLILERLYEAAGKDLAEAQNGVIILDEIDKKKSEPSTTGKDVNGKSVQQELLKLLEPSTVWICRNTVPFNTSNLTIIMMGAFVGLDEIITKRTAKPLIGFSTEKEPDININEVLPEDLISYGFIPEFVGRIPCICKLNPLTTEVATNIIYSTLEKYDILFKAKNFQFIFSPYLITRIAEKVVRSSMGARNVDAELNNIIQPALWKVLQSIEGGICEIKDDGSAEIIRASKTKKRDVELITTPVIKGYELSEENY